MKRSYFSAPLLFPLAFVLTACGGLPPTVQVDDRNSGAASPAATTPAPSAQTEETVEDKPGYYTVRKGDNLFRISQRFGQHYRSLVEWNNLPNANDIKVGQQLRVLPPEGARISSVPIDSGIESQSIDSIANTSAPKSQPATAQLGGVKIGPLGNKLPYSDQALADMQRSPGGATAKKVEPAAVGPTSFIWPADGKILTGFDPVSKGIDIAGESGQAIASAGDGSVLYAKSMQGYGNLVIIDHSGGTVSAYAHNKTILVKEGQIVSKGQKIAEMGDTGADRVKLHFEIRRFGKPVDPLSVLPLR
jgi:lipoprotein NlpD